MRRRNQVSSGVFGWLNKHQAHFRLLPSVFGMIPGELFLLLAEDMPAQKAGRPCSSSVHAGLGRCRERR